MKKLLFYLGIIVLLENALQASTFEDEVGFNIGILSIYNDKGTDFHDLTVGASYQINEYVIKPRFDFDYVSIDDYDGVKSLFKGSINAVYEYETGTEWTPYAVAGVGYEHVDGDAEDAFDSHAFVQGGVGISYNLENGVKLKAEGKVLQILGGENQDNELILTAGISMPISFFGAPSDECPVKISGPDSDRDGIPNNIDQCPNTPCYFTVDGYGCPIKATLKLYFDVDKAIIKPAYSYKVSTFAKYLLANKGTTVKITGHTDSDGNGGYNLALSQRRADAVLRELVSLGVSGARLSAQGMGESRPVAPNTTEYGKSKNRRIEVQLTYPTHSTRR